MSEQPAVPAAAPAASVPAAGVPAAPAGHPELGPLGRLLARFEPHAQAGVHDAEAVLARFRAEYRGHAKEVLYLAHLALEVAEQVDPADAPVIAELEAKALQLAKATAERAAEVLATT